MRALLGPDWEFALNIVRRPSRIASARTSLSEYDASYTYTGLAHSWTDSMLVDALRISLI